MHYSFPNIYDIDDVLWAIEGRDEFVVADKGTHTIINYNVMFEDTFLDPAEEGISIQEAVTRATRRECRGITFCNETGKIIRRPYHKFKNVNEAPETQADRIDLSYPHVILEKLDGSMISPFIVNGEMIWGTKMGATDVAKPVEEFVARNHNYLEFAQDMIAAGLTPIFEWCSRKQRIVLDYGSEDQLILTAIRQMDTGRYLTLNGMSQAIVWNIPIVRQFEPQTDMKAFLEYVHDLEDLEGFVIRFDDGHMLKLKCHWYLQIHKAKEAILQDRNIVELILEQHLDDIKAHLPAEDRDRLTKFESDFNSAIKEVVDEIYVEMVDLDQREIDRKTFAIEIAPNMNPFIKSIIFSLWDTNVIGSIEILDKVHNTIRNNLSKTAKYEAIRGAWFPGVKYND